MFSVGGILEVEVDRLGEVDLKRRELPAAADRVAHVHIDLRAVERSLALGNLVRQVGDLESLLQGSSALSHRSGSPDVLIGTSVDRSASNSSNPKSRNTINVKSRRLCSSSPIWLSRAKMWLSSWVKPRARSSPCTTPDRS